MHSQVQEIHLVDPSSLVIETLNKELKDSYITIPDKLIVHKMKGQDLKVQGEKKCIFIAGMGGKEIIEILENLIPQLQGPDQIILSPHRKVYELRGYLSQSPLLLDEEVLVFENEQYYQVLALSFHGKQKVHPFGEAIWQGPLGKAYKMHTLKNFRPHKDLISTNLVAYLEAIL